MRDHRATRKTISPPLLHSISPRGAIVHLIILLQLFMFFFFSFLISYIQLARCTRAAMCSWLWPHLQTWRPLRRLPPRHILLTLSHLINSRHLIPSGFFRVHSRFALRWENWLLHGTWDNRLQDRPVPFVRVVERICTGLRMSAQQGNSWRAGFVICFMEFMVHQGLSAAIMLCTCSSLYASLCFCENSSSSRVTISCSLYLPAYVYSSYKAQFVLNSAVCNCNRIRQMDWWWRIRTSIVLQFTHYKYKSEYIPSTLRRASHSCLDRIWLASLWYLSSNALPILCTLECLSRIIVSNSESPYLGERRKRDI